MEKLPHYRDIPKLFNICLILFLFHTIFLSLIWRQHNTGERLQMIKYKYSAFMPIWQCGFSP